MTFRERLLVHRQKLVPVLVVMALGLAALLFRAELVAWFSGQPVATGADAVATQSVQVGPFDLAVGFSPDPPRQKGNTLVVVIRDGKGKPVEGANVTVRYRMPPMGAMQEMRGEADVTERGDGRYDARFDLPMGGSWELTVGIGKGDQTGEASFNMTVGTPGLTPSGVSAAKVDATGGEALPAHRFDDATLERLRAAFAAYEQVRVLLAKDSIEGLDGQAAQVKAALGSARSSASDLPAPIKSELAEATQAAEVLGRATDVAQSRLSFGELGRHLLLLAGADPRLREGLHIFECPMTERFQKWFQPTPRLENPYMGQRMPECGVRAEWEVPQGSEPAAAGHSHPAGDDEISHYTCSMHPSVRQEGPGQCPICGMDLTPVTKQEVETGTIFVDEVRRQRIGVRTDKVTERALTLEIRAVGAVRYDETRLHDVNLRMSGWVQHLSVNETGQRVKAGQTLFTLYSPELYAAQLEHLTGVRRQAGGGGELLAHLARASRTRLELLGMSDGQISALEKRGEALKNVPIVAPASGYVIEKQIVEGARVEAGMRVYRIADLSKVWIDAEIYESDLPHVHVGQSVEVELPYVDRKRYPAKVDYVYPTLHAQTRTGRARVILENPKLELKPDMYATVFISVDLGERLSVPDSAVVYTGPRRLVFVDLGEGKLQPKVVELGPHVDGYYAVTAGLSEGDVVVTSGNFLIAAESRIRSAAQYWESENDSE